MPVPPDQQVVPGPTNQPVVAAATTIQDIVAAAAGDNVVRRVAGAGELDADRRRRAWIGEGQVFDVGGQRVAGRGVR